MASRTTKNMTAGSSMKLIVGFALTVIFLIISACLNIGLDLLFIVTFGWGVFGAAFATILSQLVAGVLFERLGKGLSSATILGAAHSALIFIVVYFLGDNMIKLFLPADEQNVETVILWARQYLLVNAAFYFPLALVNIVRFLIQGMGFSGFAVFAGVFEMAARMLVGLFFIPLFGFAAACYASPLAWICADIFLIPAFFYCRKRLQKRM